MSNGWGCRRFSSTEGSSPKSFIFRTTPNRRNLIQVYSNRKILLSDGYMAETDFVVTSGLVQFYQDDNDVIGVMDNKTVTIAYKRFGNTQNRPVGLNDWNDVGVSYFDTTINKAIWWNGFAWVDSQGSNV